MKQFFLPVCLSVCLCRSAPGGKDGQHRKQNTRSPLRYLPALLYSHTHTHTHILTASLPYFPFQPLPANIPGRRQHRDQKRKKKKRTKPPPQPSQPSLANINTTTTRRQQRRLHQHQSLNASELKCQRTPVVASRILAYSVPPESPPPVCKQGS